MAADPYFSSVVLLLHCDSADGSSVFVDSSSNLMPVQAVGNAVASQAESKFAGACLSLPYVSGGVARLNAGNEHAYPFDGNSWFAFGTGDFAVEMWLKTDSTGEKYLLGQESFYGRGNWLFVLDDGILVWADGYSGAALVSGTTAINDGQWNHIAASRESGTIRLFVNGVLDGSGVVAVDYNNDRYPLGIGSNSDPWSGGSHVVGYIDEVRVTKGVARYTADFTAPTEPFSDGELPGTASVAAPNPLAAQAIRVLAAMTITASADAPSAIGAPRILARAYEQITAQAKAPSVLRAAVVCYHDFTGFLGNAVTLFAMDLITPAGVARIPISSWQATLQTGSSNYVQCVIPACTMWQDAINAATEFVIYRRAELPNGAAIEYEMARAPSGQAQYDRSPERHTCTLSGYSDAFAASEDPSASYDRTLTGVRSISSGSSYRVRCAMDWLLRPGQRAFVDGAPFIVKFINYYAPSGSDAYMDVGG